MKITTTLYEIIHSELINSGHDEFVNKHNLTFFNKEYAFIQKIMSYDNDVHKIVDELFFNNIKLNDPVSDRNFKKTFINKFYNRQIAYQTVEVFTSQVIYTLMINIDYLNSLYDNLDDFILGKTNSKNDDNGTDINDNRYANATLPQDQVNTNIDNLELDFADTNSISRTKSEKTGQSNSLSTNHSLDQLLKSSGLLDSVFIEFDKKCFLQVW